MKFFVGILVFILLVNFLTKTTYASCIGGIPVSKHKDKADVIVSGVVRQAFENYSNFSVETYYKGQGANEIRVTGKITPETGMGTSVDLFLSEGERYLLFLNGKVDEIMKANSCNGSRALKDGLTEEESGVLLERSSPVPTPGLSPLVKIDNQTIVIASVALLIGILLGRIILRK